MNRSSVFFSLLLATMAAQSVACIAGNDDDSSSEDSEIKKKVKPKGGNGAFDLLKPSFATGFAGQFNFDGPAMALGERREKVPGSYNLQLVGATIPDGQTMAQTETIAITAGTVTARTPGGLRVRFSEPVTLGGARVMLTPPQGYAGFLNAGGAWQANANGGQMLSLAGKVVVAPATETNTLDAIVTEGAIKEVVLPTSRVKVALDEYDAAYPNPASCSAAYVRAGAWGYQSTAFVRNTNGSPNASFVVPQGSRADVAVVVYGFEVKQPTVAGGTNAFTLNRLEVDHVEVAQSGGGTQMVPGTYTIARKNADGTFTPLNCNAPTQTGVDLPDGTYRVTSSARGTSGTVTSTEEVSFP
ncbi:MAG: hypothetical protein HOO96_17785 [Polyangiaceae bacterium]|nr:hypothetical protein [Polyangiaceae bacterium]